MSAYQFQLNGKAASIASWDPDQPLLYVLRNGLGCMARSSDAGLDSPAPARFCWKGRRSGVASRRCDSLPGAA